MNIVLEEVDECCFWLEIIKEREWMNLDIELKEANYSYLCNNAQKNEYKI